jgi:nondiscriminating glutamyl-tRNA synthetase
MSETVRVRYAPSPTGHLHIGGARTALFNYLFARHHQGQFIIRIEDTDTKRNVEGGEQNQLTYLKWLGIDWDESVDIGGEYGPYRQTDRLDLYKKYCQQLLDQGHAYYCYCTEEELEQEREEQLARGETPQYSGKHRHMTEEQRKEYEAQGLQPSIRFLVPEGKTFTFDDLVRGQISFESDGIGDFVIVKKDGIPTYNFAVVIDDHLMRISHVLRGEEHISNTPRQLMIYEALGWASPKIGHMTIITNEDRKKLSKRDESIVQFIEQYKDMGYLPEAMFNFIGLLGWSPEGEDEILSQEQLIQLFNTDRLSKSPAIFDTNKLAWMNNHYIKKTELPRLVELCVPHLQRAGRIPESLHAEQQAWVSSLVALYQEQMNCAADIVELSSMFFAETLEMEPEAAELLKEEHVPTVIGSFLNQIEESTDWSADAIQAMLKNVQKETGYKGKALFMSTRVAITGQMHGRDLNQTIALLGKGKVTTRLRSLLS